MAYRIDVDESAPHTVLGLHRTVRAEHAGDDIGAGMDALYAMARELGLLPMGPPATTYHGDFRPGTTIEVDFDLPVTTSVPGTEVTEFAVRRTPRQLFAHTSHRGDYSHIDAAYRALDRWIRTSGLHAAGPPTEVYPVGPNEVAVTEELCTEIRVPLASSALLARVTAPVDTAHEATREALLDNGFDIAAEFDVGAISASCSGVDIGGHRIICAYAPDLVRDVLATDHHDPLPPYTVSLRADGARTVVEAIDPEPLTRRSVPALRSIAREAHTRLERTLRQLVHRFTETDAPHPAETVPSAGTPASGSPAPDSR
ncbi:GyrI-like domain-containing protein [Nocardia paucivorans]|uniref:GyrI-like domain-containing protein n=1 Tax=Nocardia paucivorans TaxID=114259 RepID=UPI0002FB6EC1|nr:GyrI-like domain-containing protein [Nocardia paucivorans]